MAAAQIRRTFGATAFHALGAAEACQRHGGSIGRRRHADPSPAPRLTVCPDRCPRKGRVRNPPRHGANPPHAPPAARRCRQRQNHRRRLVRADRHRIRRAGGRDGADRNPCRTAFHQVQTMARTFRSRSRLALGSQRKKPKTKPKPNSPTAPSKSPSARTPCFQTTSSSKISAW